MSNSRMNDPERTGDYHPGGNDEPAVPAAQPQHVGRYRVERVLGQGGFGLVYLAHDNQLQRLVAIKVPHRKLVERPEAAEAYLTEARTVANLDHPHIVPVFDVGSTEQLERSLKQAEDERNAAIDALELVDLGDGPR